MKTTGVLRDAFAASSCLCSRSEIDAMLYLSSVDETGRPPLTARRERGPEATMRSGDRPRSISQWTAAFHAKGYCFPSKRLQQSSDQLDVLPRHRLLLKPGGFEGLCQGQEHFKADRLAVAKGGHVGELVLNFDATALSPPVVAGQRYHLIGSRVDDLDEGQAAILPLPAPA